MSYNELITFLYEGKKIRVFQDEEREAWFVWKDICNVLMLNNTTEFLNNLHEDERCRCLISPDKKEEVDIISESGLHFLIVQNRNHDSEKLWNWIASEVLQDIWAGRRKDLKNRVALPEEVELERFILEMPYGRREKAMAHAMRMNKAVRGNMASLEDCFLRFCWLLYGKPAVVEEDSPLGKAAQWARENLIPIERGEGIQSMKVYSAYVEWTKRENINPVSLTAFGKMMRSNFKSYTSNRTYYLVQWRKEDGHI